MTNFSIQIPFAFVPYLFLILLPFKNFIIFIFNTYVANNMPKKITNFYGLQRTNKKTATNMALFWGHNCHFETIMSLH